MISEGFDDVEECARFESVVDLRKLREERREEGAVACIECIEGG